MTWEAVPYVSAEGLLMGPGAHRVLRTNSISSSEALRSRSQSPSYSDHSSHRAARHGRLVLSRESSFRNATKSEVFVPQEPHGLLAPLNCGEIRCNLRPTFLESSSENVAGWQRRCIAKALNVHFLDPRANVNSYFEEELRREAGVHIDMKCSVTTGAPTSINHCRTAVTELEGACAEAGDALESQSGLEHEN